MNQISRTVQRFVLLCYRFQESRLTCARLFAVFQAERRQLDRAVSHSDFPELPVYSFITAITGVRHMVRRAPIAGAADLHDDPTTALTWTQRYLDGAVCLSISGDLDLASLSLFRARLRSGIGPADNLILDVSALRYIDSTGIHALLNAYQTLTLTGRCMALVDVPPNVQRVLHAFGADEILPVFSTVEAALKNFRNGTNPR